MRHLVSAVINGRTVTKEFRTLAERDAFLLNALPKMPAAPKDVKLPLAVPKIDKPPKEPKNVKPDKPAKPEKTWDKLPKRLQESPTEKAGAKKKTPKEEWDAMVKRESSATKKGFMLGGPGLVAEGGKTGNETAVQTIAGMGGKAAFLKGFMSMPGATEKGKGGWWVHPNGRIMHLDYRGKPMEVYAAAYTKALGLKPGDKAGVEPDKGASKW